jgi:Domain of unknown function (DUF397)
MDNSHLTWRKSTHSGGNGGECIEVASVAEAFVAIRDSKRPDGPKLVITSPAWESFVGLVRNTT